MTTNFVDNPHGTRSLHELRNKKIPLTENLRQLAYEALKQGDIGRLDELKVRGFSPWMSPLGPFYKKAATNTLDQFNENALAGWAWPALYEPSGKSLLWLINNYEGFCSELPEPMGFWSHCPDDPDFVKPKPAIMMLELFGLTTQSIDEAVGYLVNQNSLVQTLEKVERHNNFSGFDHYIESENEFEKKDGPQHLWDHLVRRAIYAPKKAKGINLKAREEFAQFLCKKKPDVINQTQLRFHLINAAYLNHDPSPALVFADLLPLDVTNNQSFAIHLNKGPREEWQIRARDFFKRSRYMNSDSWLDLGSALLIGGNNASIEIALNRGWIKNIELDATTDCEHPYAARYDKALRERDAGKVLNMDGRMARIQRTIEKSDASDIEKKHLLAYLESSINLEKDPPPSKTRLTLPIKMSLSPQLIVLGCANNSSKSKFEEISWCLSEHGFLLKEALEVAKLFGVAQKEDRPIWVKRILEKEAIREATGPAQTTSKRLSL